MGAKKLGLKYELFAQFVTKNQLVKMNEIIQSHPKLKGHFSIRFVDNLDMEINPDLGGSLNRTSKDTIRFITEAEKSLKKKK